MPLRFASLKPARLMYLMVLIFGHTRDANHHIDLIVMLMLLLSNVPSEERF
jgi:hypothetical protein